MTGMNLVFDVVVVGGGISGLGVAMAALNRGYRVGVIEQGRLLQATSKNSLRIIHGGFRYLQTLNLLRTVESARAQEELLRTFPDFIKPLPCLLPLETLSLKNPFFARIGIEIYKLLVSRGYRLPPPSILPASFVQEEVPALKEFANSSYLYWNDAVITEPAYLGQYLVEHMITKGVKFIEDTRVLRFKYENGFFYLVNETKGNEQVVLCRSLINTSGPWLQRLYTDDPFRRVTHEDWALGYNVVVNKQYDPKYALAVKGPSGRTFFAVPRGKKTAIGTGYHPHHGDVANTEVSELDLSKFVSDFCAAIGDEGGLTRADIDSVESGVLPVDSFSGDDVKLRGRHKMVFDKGFGEVLSTKYTTFLTQGRQVIDKAYGYLGGP